MSSVRISILFDLVELFITSLVLIHCNWVCEVDIVEQKISWDTLGLSYLDSSFFKPLVERVKSGSLVYPDFSILFVLRVGAHLRSGGLVQ